MRLETLTCAIPKEFIKIIYLPVKVYCRFYEQMYTTFYEQMYTTFHEQMYTTFYEQTYTTLTLQSTTPNQSPRHSASDG
jgi:hypothetical protein